VAATTVCNTPDDGRKLRPKHVELKNQIKRKKLHLVAIYITSIIPNVVYTDADNANLLMTGYFCIKKFVHQSEILNLFLWTGSLENIPYYR